MIIAEWPAVRWYKTDDLGQMVDVHRACFPDEHWEEEDFVKFVNNKSGRNNVLKVIAAGGVVYGTFLYTVEADAVRFRRVGVREDVRKQGLASFALGTVCGPNSPLKRKLFIARVREDNLPAIRLLTSTGFLFDPNKKRERDEVRKVDYYEFTLVKTGVPAVIVPDR